ncbi:hypothetical protein COU57_03955 [Candidatus Pacearchaeota archaeon CG10_big_fil_rev_8_21_14_0_10_32_14]|nr:MAG: hypothetical protein COU57_03955 [Candidatus Pacearchaeota archaeon CG10_big_fil_rev_8_21_14_0_10_32_14]
MKNKKGDALNILYRYIILLLIAIPGISIFYFLFTSLTIYPVYYLVQIYSKATLYGNLITLSNNISLEIVGACVAGSAYLLLTILNLSTSNIKLKKRILMLLSSYFIFLIFNIIRIVFLGYLVFIGSAYFDIVHSVLWYGISTIFVVALWFAQIHYFKVNSIPIYSDIKFLYKNSTLLK